MVKVCTWFFFQQMKKKLNKQLHRRTNNVSDSFYFVSTYGMNFFTSIAAIFLLAHFIITCLQSIVIKGKIETIPYDSLQQTHSKPKFIWCGLVRFGSVRFHIAALSYLTSLALLFYCCSCVVDVFFLCFHSFVFLVTITYSCIRVHYVIKCREEKNAPVEMLRPQFWRHYIEASSLRMSINFPHVCICL